MILTFSLTFIIVYALFHPYIDFLTAVAYCDIVDSAAFFNKYFLGSFLWIALPVICLFLFGYKFKWKPLTLFLSMSALLVSSSYFIIYKPSFKACVADWTTPDFANPNLEIFTWAALPLLLHGFVFLLVLSLINRKVKSRKPI